MDWPDFKPELWTTILNSTLPTQENNRDQPSSNVRILASDRDAGAIQTSISNAERACVAQYIEFSQRSLSAVEPEGKGWLITNPPYGIRVSENKDLRNLYAQLGNILQSKCRGWHFAVMCSDLGLLHQLKLPQDTTLSLVNGGIPVRVARGTISE